MRLLGGKEQYVLGEEQRDMREAEKRKPVNVYAPVSSMTDVTITHTERTVLADARAAAIVVYLPDGKQYLPVMVKKVDSTANAVTIVPKGRATIEGASSLALTAEGAAVLLLSDGTDWHKFSEVAGS